jgi:Fe-S-cluster containining protein
MENELGPTVQVDFALDIGSGRLDASAVVPTGNTTLTELLPVLQNLSSNIIDSAAQLAGREGYNISCRLGCAACCRHLIPLSIFEAELLAEWIRTLPAERQAELALRFEATLVALRDSGLLVRMDTALAMPGSAEEKALAVDYLREGVACPFLENELCIIHPIRPLICREYIVTSPAENCVDPTKYPVIGLPVPVKLSHVLFEFGSQVAAGTRGWFPLVFLFAWMRGGGGHPGNAVSAPGPQLLYEIVKRLATVTASAPEATEG